MMKRPQLGSFEIYNDSADLQAAPAIAVGPHGDTTDVIVEVPFHGADGGTNVHIVAIVLVAPVLVPKLHHAAPSGKTERRGHVTTATATPGHAVGALTCAGRHPREDAATVVVVLVRGERASVLAAALGFDLLVALSGMPLGLLLPGTERLGLLRLILGTGLGSALVLLPGELSTHLVGLLGSLGFGSLL